MLAFLFFLLIILWGTILIQTHSFVVCFCALLAIAVIFVLSKNQNVKLPKTKLLPSKIILTISFWSCVAFCLNAYQKSVNCLNCQLSHWKTVSEPHFTNGWNFQNIKNIWIMYPRFVVIIGLFTLWAIAFVYAMKKENKK
ncbi:MAG: hypothetical protein J6P93_05570 [Alphaproteobacteria bacterium]|nr:hypothetical protein [Alphaproteobacteria bacterium]